MSMSQEPTEEEDSTIVKDDGSTEWTDSFISSSLDTSFDPIAVSTPLMKYEECHQSVSIDFEEMLGSLGFLLVGKVERKKIQCARIKPYFEKFIISLKETDGKPNEGTMLFTESIISKTTSWWAKKSRCGCKIEVPNMHAQSREISLAELEIHCTYLKEIIILKSEKGADSDEKGKEEEEEKEEKEDEEV